MPFLLYICTSNTGVSYVGITRQSLCARITGHNSSVSAGSNTYFHNALRKHGFGSFEFSVIEEHSSLTEVLEAEIFMISYLKSIGADLYNTTSGGEGGSPRRSRVFPKGRKRTKGMTGRTHSKSAIEKMRAAMKGKRKKPFSESHKEKLRTVLEASRETAADLRRGTKLSDETKRKMSESRKGRIPWNKGLKKGCEK